MRYAGAALSMVETGPERAPLVTWRLKQPPHSLYPYARSTPTAALDTKANLLLNRPYRSDITSKTSSSEYRAVHKTLCFVGKIASKLLNHLTGRFSPSHRIGEGMGFGPEGIGFDADDGRTDWCILKSNR
ncbi:hypothetical protein EVAR_33687_1 [Eumeta japonica]|uniref:Uncharacterized protein n=1 Tax=Eumeta variegata TaxID=151549 RepID=A0A4C1VN59_EUMVA|nr:hypothetical protein EVAR_33687_1 [Eumeta japonica]